MTRVLLADESVTIRKVVELVLSDEGFQVEAVSTGDEALASIQSAPPALVLADVKTKGKNGYELAQAIKSNPGTAAIPVLLLAGAFEPVNEELLQKSGANGSMTKPFEAADLVAKVRSLVGAEAAPAAPEEEIVFDMSGGEEEEAAAVEAVEAAEAVEAFEAAPAEAVEAVEAVEAEEDLWDLGEAEAVAEPVEAVEAVEAMEAAPIVEEAPAVVPEAPPIPEPQVAPEPAPQPAQPQPAPAAPAAAAPSAEAIAAAMPGREEMSQIFRELAAEQLDKMMATIDLKAMLVDTLAPTIKESMTKILWEATPEITEKLLKDAVQESLSTLNEKLESVIWETVPELAETIIRQEIDKLKSEA